MENKIEPELLDLENLKAMLKLAKQKGYKKSLGISREEFDEFKKQLEFQIERLTFNKTAGYKKVENYVKDLAKRPMFFEFLKEARKKFKIPEKGFDYSVARKKQYQMIKDAWNSEEFRKYVEKFCGEHKRLPGLPELVASYILFNDIKPVPDEIGIPIVRVVDISSLSGKKADALALKVEKNLPPEAKGKFKAETIAQIGKLGQLLAYSETYPIAVLLHPYMSQRDVIDAIKKLFKTHIEPLQKELRNEKIALEKVRKKSERVEERNRFICDSWSKGMRMPELRTAIREKYHEILDGTYIYKIIKEGRLKNK